jgi:hypothetical protein
MKGRKQGLGSASHAGDQIHTVTRGETADPAGKNQSSNIGVRCSSRA